MTKGDGPCVIDAVAVGEVEINLLGPSPRLTSKHALIQTETGMRFGAGNWNTGWSPETMQRLQALITSMEQDICQGLFRLGDELIDEAVQAPTAGGPPQSDAPFPAVPSL